MLPVGPATCFWYGGDAEPAVIGAAVPGDTVAGAASLRNLLWSGTDYQIDR